MHQRTLGDKIDPVTDETWRSSVAETARARQAAAHQTVSCSEITGLNCDYVAGADGNTNSTVGHHVDQVMALLGMHMANVHQIGLDLEGRNQIRARFASLK